VSSRIKLYEERRAYFEGEVKNKARDISNIGYLRLLTFAVGAGISGFTYIKKLYYMSTILFLAAAAIFTYLVYLHAKVTREKKYSEIMREINGEGIRRRDGKWKEFADDGGEFKEENHSYSEDLDIFGKNSLFQWINTSSTYHGRKKLAHILANPLKDIKSIKERQKAVTELSERLEWRQEFSAEGRLISEKSSNPNKLAEWAISTYELYTEKWLILLCRILPAITISLIIMSVVLQLFSYKIALIAVAIQILMLIPRHVERVLALNTIYLFKDNVVIYYRLLTSIESQEFKSDYLKALKDRLNQKGKRKATQGIKELQKIADKVSDQKNLFYIIINILLLWDYQCMIQMERWKREYGLHFEKWLDTIAEFEAVNSLAGMYYDNENWTMPEVKESGTILKARSMGHPLLAGNRVNNDFNMEEDSNIILITGSNMSGKSTFQRTVGINLILSYIGATVCAEYFSCTIANVYTCMRISDNLEKSISSFYAEILRIKMIVDAAKRGERVFFLLDEIFKGTNSIDRHTGAKLLIKQLGHNNASGLISTHDLELGEMEKEYSKIRNFHFQEYYEEGKLKFDYKLRKGISTTRNAMYIMKMAGID
jgi:DNA mismatch repair ATPase MutS